MIKLALRTYVLNFSINILFDGIIKQFRSNVIVVKGGDITDNMVGKTVIFVESHNGYDYVLPAIIERNKSYDPDVSFSRPWHKYTLKGKKRFRNKASFTRNGIAYYTKTHSHPDIETNEYMWPSMTFHILNI